MKKTELLKKAVHCFCLVVILCLISPAGVAGIPWDNLTQDWWIDFLDGNDPNMYPVNAADDNDILAAYPISFVTAATGNKARGMNALKFGHGGLTEGHLVSHDKSGSFKIINTGDSKTFTDILLLVAIDADALAGSFSMALNLAGQTPYMLDVNDFVFYNNPYGRPSGYYSVTSPNVEPISYAFNTAMVCVYGISGVTSLAPEGTITVEYSFNNIPAPVVFSVYGYVATDPVPTIYHTNRAMIDNKDPSKKVSTFAVTVGGDLNGDLKVDIADFAMMSENWLMGVD